MIYWSFSHHWKADTLAKLKADKANQYTVLFHFNRHSIFLPKSLISYNTGWCSFCMTSNNGYSISLENMSILPKHSTSNSNKNIINIWYLNLEFSFKKIVIRNSAFYSKLFLYIFCIYIYFCLFVFIFDIYFHFYSDILYISLDILS